MHTCNWNKSYRKQYLTFTSCDALYFYSLISQILESAFCDRLHRFYRLIKSHILKKYCIRFWTWLQWPWLHLSVAGAGSAWHEVGALRCYWMNWWLERGVRNEIVIKGVGEVLGCKQGGRGQVLLVFMFGVRFLFLGNMNQLELA